MPFRCTHGGFPDTEFGSTRRPVDVEIERVLGLAVCLHKNPPGLITPWLDAAIVWTLGQILINPNSRLVQTVVA